MKMLTLSLKALFEPVARAWGEGATADMMDEQADRRQSKVPSPQMQGRARSAQCRAREGKRPITRFEPPRKYVCSSLSSPTSLSWLSYVSPRFLRQCADIPLV